jgi:ribosome recycling factor
MKKDEKELEELKVAIKELKQMALDMMSKKAKAGLITSEQDKLINDPQ